jgi:LPXTG-motif cell wall-anchored protein
MVTAYPEPVKEFYIYTGLRIALFLGSFGIVVGLWFAITGEAQIFWAVVIGFVVSGLGSYFLLNRQREALARRVQTRAEAMTAKVEEMRAKEDVDDV